MLAAPFGLDLGCTEVTVSTGPGLGELKAEDAGAEAGVKLEDAAGALLVVGCAPKQPSKEVQVNNPC